MSTPSLSARSAPGVCLTPSFQIMLRPALLSAAAVALATGIVAQSNTVVGLDGRLEILDNITYWGRRGAAYPGGEVGMSMRNTMCNPGSVSIPWYAQMAENHPKFGFLITRLSNDRMVQISDRSYCKHAFTSASTSGACGPCNGIGGNQMGVTCSDTYSAGNNGSRNNLGPADEINPWLGTWNHTGSYFDQGDPNVGAPGNIDGAQSPINVGSDPVKNRVTIKESDLAVPGASFFYGIQLIHEGESLANRWDNIKSRGMTASWNGSTWSVANSAVGEAFGSILQHWPGATVNMVSNGSDDGRFYVASKATSLGGGMFHYEYAIHNVDNSRGGASLRVPIDAAAVASNFTFRDIDTNPLNDWTAARVGNEIVFTAPGSNPQNWNTIFNFGFDANFAPGNAFVSIDEARVGPGTLFVTVGAKAPSGATYAQASPIGTGCGGSTCTTSFYELFTTTGLDLANTSFTLTYNSGTYTLGTGTGSWIAPAGTSLPAGDEVTHTVALPFALPYPGGTTNTLYVCSNGYVSAASNPTVYNPSAAVLLGGSPRWAGLWHDFNPSANTLKADVNASRAVISFAAVPNYNTTGTATFQYQFYPNGTVHVIYQAVSLAGNAYLVGWSPGAANDPGGIDVSSSLGAGLQFCSGPTPNMALATTDRPVLGTTIDFDTTNIPAGSVLGLSVLSPTEYSPGLDLGIIGMPTCTLYAGLDIITGFATPGSSATVGWAVPNDNTLSGVAAAVQTITLTPGINAFGAAASNALQLLIGAN